MPIPKGGMAPVQPWDLITSLQQRPVRIHGHSKIQGLLATLRMSYKPHVEKNVPESS